MTPKEVTRILAILKSVRVKTDTDQASVLGWSVALDDVPYPLAERAARRWVRFNRYFPAPVEIRQLVAEELGIPSPAQAWDRVQDDVLEHKGGEHLTAAEKAAVRAIGGTWVIRQSDVPYSIRERFMKAYEPLMWGALDDALLALPPGPGGEDVVVKELA